MLFLNSFSENEISNYVGLLASYIKTQKETYLPLATPLTEDEKNALKPYFGDAILNQTFFYLKSDGPIEAPDFLRNITEGGIFFPVERLRAVTFVDVVVTYGPLDPRVRFHELVHAVQYQKLGLKQFANKYLRGFLARGSYEKIPLEVNARMLDEAFAQNPSVTFSVEQEIQRWTNENKF